MIDKQNQIDEISKIICNYPQCIHYNEIGGCQVGKCHTADVAEQLYNADFHKRKVGEWVQVGDDNFDLCFQCSYCREEFSCEVDLTIFAKYCPNCGARMKGEKEDG